MNLSKSKSPSRKIDHLNSRKNPSVVGFGAFSANQVNLGQSFLAATVGNPLF